MLDLIKDISKFLNQNKSIKYGFFVSLSSLVISFLISILISWIYPINPRDLYYGPPFLDGLLLRVNTQLKAVGLISFGVTPFIALFWTVPGSLLFVLGKQTQSKFFSKMLLFVFSVIVAVGLQFLNFVMLGILFVPNG